MVNSLLTAIVRADGDSLVMHVGERPYVVASSGPVELSSRPLTLEAVTGMLGQLLPFDARRALEELGAVEHALPRSAAAQGDRFTVVAARGGEDIWIEVRRHRKPSPATAQAALPSEPFVSPAAAAESAEPASTSVPAETPAPSGAAIVAEAPAAAVVAEARAAAPAGISVSPAQALPEAREAVVQQPASTLAPIPAVQQVAEPVAAPVAEVPPLAEVPVAEVAVSEEAVAEVVVIEAPVVVEAPFIPVPAPVIAPDAVAPFAVGAPVAAVAVAEPAVPAAADRVEAVPVVTPPVTPAPVVPAPIVSPPVPARVVPAPSAPAAVAAPTAALVVTLPGNGPPEHPARDPRPAPASPPPARAVEARVVPPVRVEVGTESPLTGRGERTAAPPPPGPALSFDALVDASLDASESPVRPLVAAPIVERPMSELPSFEQAFEGVPARQASAGGSVRQVGTAPPEAAPAVVLPLARSPLRADASIRSLASPRIAGIDRLLRLCAARGANTLYLTSQARPSIRLDGELSALEAEPVLGPNEVESLLLDLAPERSREALEAGEGLEWMSEVPEVGRVRCQSFRDHRGPGGIFQMISARPASAELLGLAREIQALCAEPEGLVLVSGPRASGKSTLISALVDLINRTRNDYVITIESQIKFVHESRGCLVSQREVRGGNEDLAVAVRAGWRENPDVLVIEDMRSPEVVRLALEAMEAGHLVIGAVSAHGAATAVGRILDQFSEPRRSQMQLALAEGLRGIVSQVLLRKSSGGRVAAREILLNIPSIANLIAEGRIGQLPLAIDNGRKHGMVPLNDALAAFVQSGVVDAKEAYRKAFERPAFLAVLRREGVDTSFVERLA